MKRYITRFVAIASLLILWLPGFLACSSMRVSAPDKNVTHEDFVQAVKMATLFQKESEFAISTIYLFQEEQIDSLEKEIHSEQFVQLTNSYFTAHYLHREAANRVDKMLTLADSLIAQGELIGLEAYNFSHQIFGEEYRACQDAADAYILGYSKAFDSFIACADGSGKESENNTYRCRFRSSEYAGQKKTYISALKKLKKKSETLFREFEHRIELEKPSDESIIVMCAYLDSSFSLLVELERIEDLARLEMQKNPNKSDGLTRKILEWFLFRFPEIVGGF